MSRKLYRRATFPRALVVACLVAMIFGLIGPAAVPASAQQGLTFNTLRVYGLEEEGEGLPEKTAGQAGTADPLTGLVVEDPPYTDPMAPFLPQHEQAPEMDSVTWNPIWMYENQTFDENQAKGLYDKIFAGTLNASEKVWLREWYEPNHWDKDLNANSIQDDPDEQYPAIMQEYTYMLMEPRPDTDKPEPAWGRAGDTSFVFPIGMRASDLFDGSGFVDTSSDNARFGYGLTSLDANFDGIPDIVHVESELTLFEETEIAADFDGDGVLDPLDRDTTPLNGNELAVLRLNAIPVARGGYIQFLDHMVQLRDVFDDSVLLDIYYLGDIVPRRFNRSVTLYTRDMALAGTDGPAQVITAVRNGGTGTNMCNFPTGPWFVYLASVDTVEESARLMLGRAAGNTFSGMEDRPYSKDVRPGDPWFLKRFYADGHEYNVTAIYTRNGANVEYAYRCESGNGPASCDLDCDNNGLIDLLGPADPTEFEYITLRTPIPKVPTRIEQHSVTLQHYLPLDYLSMLPPYNYEHYIFADVQEIDEFADIYSEVDFIGPLIGPVPPVLQKHGPYPYVVETSGRRTVYTDIREMRHFYVRELPNPQFRGQLLELYAEDLGVYPEAEYWYAERFEVQPNQYTEFVFPDISETRTGASTPDLYLLTSAFWAPQADYRLWIQDQSTPLVWTGDRVKFWYDPHTGGKKYKDDQGVRIYGRDSETAGDPAATDPVISAPVEVPPYTDPYAPFNPKNAQAPVKDILTFNPIYMDEEHHGQELLSNLYHSISVEEGDAREKVFFRMWYEPEYVDKILRTNPLVQYAFPALMQEFTYMFVDTNGVVGNPTHGQPGTSHFIFPIGTKATELPAPVDAELPPALIPSCGYGLTTFDSDFDGQEDIVTIHSEQSLAAMTGVGADFDGNGSIDQLMSAEGVAAGGVLTGEELVVFAVENITLRRGESAMFLDHMVTLENVTPNGAELQFWYTGGGLHAYPGGVYSLHPDKIGLAGLYGVRDMAIVTRTRVRRIAAGQSNLGQTDGAWFAWVQAINTTAPARETVNLVIGRALGATHSAIDNGAAQHDMAQGDPWYLKRFFVDGHEYNVVAIRVMPADVVNPGDEDWEFKYITIRTPVPKVNFVNSQDSQKLEGYFRGDDPICGDTSIISVMPPFNYEHTIVRDIQAEQTEDCVGDLVYNRPPLVIRITDESREPQFFGELKELLYMTETLSSPVWSVEQFNTLPDQYTEVQLPPGELYHLTLDWTTDEIETADWEYESCSITTTLPAMEDLMRVQFWYDPTDPYDIYVNDEAVECLGVTVRGVVHAYSGACHATHYIITPEGATLYIFDSTGLLGQYVGRDVTLTGCWYDTVVCEPGIEIIDPGDIIPHAPATATPTRTPTTGPTATHTPTPTRTATQPTVPVTATPTVTGTPVTGATPTPQAGKGHISGVVRLEGRMNHAGTTVSVPSVPGANAVTDASGCYTIYNVPAGTYTVVAKISRYLFSQKSDVVVNAGATTTLPEVVLRGGDANDDNVVDIFDLVILGLAYNSTPADPDWDARADINNDNAVNLWDLVLVGTNYNRTAPTPWSILSLTKASKTTLEAAQARLALAEDGGDLVVEVRVSKATQLYGAEFELSFDPSILVVRDADLGQAGVQIEGGNLFAADSAFVIENSVDNTKGIVRYALTLLRPAEPVSGEGVVARIRFRARAEKKAMVSMPYLSLYSKATESVQEITGVRLLVNIPAKFDKELTPPMLLKGANQ